MIASVWIWSRRFANAVVGSEKNIVPNRLIATSEGGTANDSDCTSAPECWRATLDSFPLLGKGFADRGLTVGPVGEHGIAASR